jgi:hypothetical protein
MVEAGQFRFVETLDDRQNSRVDESDVGIGVAITDLSDSYVVGGFQVLDRICPLLDVTEEGNESPGVETLVDPVVHFDEDRRRDDKRLIGRLDQRPTGGVVCIRAVE